jgi:hypothetical protein
MSGAASLLMILEQLAVYAGMRRSDCRFVSGSGFEVVREAVGEDPIFCNFYAMQLSQ